MRRCWTKVIEHDSINNKKWNKIQIEMLQNVQHIANNHRILKSIKYVYSDMCV